MKKFLRMTIFQFKSAFINIKRHLGLSLSATLSVCISLILVAVFIILSGNLNYMTRNIEAELSIRVSIDHIVKEDMLMQIQQDIANMNGVVEVEYRSKDDELKAYKKEYKSDQALFSMYKGDNNPLVDVLNVKVRDASQIKVISKTIAKMSGVLKVSDGGLMTQKLLDFLMVIRYGGSAIVVLLLLVAIFLIANKIKMSIYTRRDEFAIMRFVGAGNWFIRFPMMLEGLFIGICGGIPAALLTLAAYFKLYQEFNGVMMSEMLTLQPSMQFAWMLIAVIVACGMVVGLLGSLFSTSRNLRWKR